MKASLSLGRAGPARTAAALASAAAVYLACWGGLRWAAEAGDWGVMLKQWVFKSGLIAMALAAWWATRRPMEEMGWRRSTPGVQVWRWYLLAALGMGAATVVMIQIGARHPVAAQLTMGQIVVTVWGLSSVSEEIFVRGFVQSLVGQPGGGPLGRGASTASALFFAAMHVPLVWSGAGAAGGWTIVAATLVVGWAAAEARRTTGSLLHPVGVHVVGNMAALPFGVLGVLVFRLVHGRLPAM